VYGDLFFHCRQSFYRAASGSLLLNRLSKLLNSCQINV
jgi:hypothetical protein